MIYNAINGFGCLWDLGLGTKHMQHTNASHKQRNMNQYSCEGNKTVLRNHYILAKHSKTHWFPYSRSVNLSLGQGTKVETLTDSHFSFCWSINRGAAVPSEGLTNGQLSVSGRWTWKTAVWGFSSPWCESCTKQPVRKLMQTWKRKKVLIFMYLAANVTGLIIVSYETKSGLPLGSEWVKSSTEPHSNFRMFLDSLETFID